MLFNIQREFYVQQDSCVKKGAKMGTGKSRLHKFTVEAIKAGRICISGHARDRMEECDLLVEGVIYSVLRGTLIEENFYYKRYYNPTCSIKGITKSGVKVNSIWAYNEETKWAMLVTAYCDKGWFSRVRR
ncbi:DUF4258 domain-containing protein [Microcoleus sp. EPA2]|jgi:hypothetical protein|uniref:DUF4258 domain-containing protein n=1 Tax=Microcoleus sp. EPA2 TaxID=2841654 RepID=UPI00312BAF91